MVPVDAHFNEYVYWILKIPKKEKFKEKNYWSTTYKPEKLL